MAVKEAESISEQGLLYRSKNLWMLAFQIPKVLRASAGTKRQKRTAFCVGKKSSLTEWGKFFINILFMPQYEIKRY